MRYAAALFDMDGLLLDTERLYRDAFLRAGDAVQFPHADRLNEIFLKLVGLRAKDSRQIMEAEIAPHTDTSRFNQLWDEYADKLLSRDIPVKPCVVEVLSALQSLNVPCVVATSTRTSFAEAKLERAGIGKFFATVIGGEQCDRGKPDPEIYMRAARAVGAMAEHCAAFEDSNTGIRAAVASGAVAVQIPDLVPPTDEVRALRHVIAPDLMTGAQKIGLLK